MTAPTAHTLGAFIGAPSLGFHSTCSCGERLEGATKDELRTAHQRHAGVLATKPGVEKARRALAASLERGKPVPCGSCHGSGDVARPGDRDVMGCRDCHGTGSTEPVEVAW